MKIASARFFQSFILLCLFASAYPVLAEAQVEPPLEKGTLQPIDNLNGFI